MSSIHSFNSSLRGYPEPAAAAAAADSTSPLRAPSPDSLTPAEQEMRDLVAGLIEDHRKMKEVLADTQKGLSTLTGKVKKLKDDLKAEKLVSKGLRTDLYKQKIVSKGLDRKVTTLKGRVKILKDDLKDEKLVSKGLRTELDEQKIVSKGLDTEVTTLKGRVQELEVDLATEQAKAAQLTKNLAAEKLLSTGHSASVTKLTKDLAAKKLTSASLSSRVIQLEKENARLSSPETYSELWDSRNKPADRIRVLFSDYVEKRYRFHNRHNCDQVKIALQAQDKDLLLAIRKIVPEEPTGSCARRQKFMETMLK